MRDTVYHCMSKASDVDKILKNGMRIYDSGESFLGRGAYFSTSLANAKQYGDNCVETDIDYISDFEPYPPFAELGTYFQYLDDIGQRDSDEPSWREYQSRARAIQEDSLHSGAKGAYRNQRTSTQVVVYDPVYLAQLRFKKVES